ncbi:MAG: helix-turn-helix domain-containing protein, partial [Myxococcota bacterium]|nr:helix-turn-helix domain-containing protein [Myxococcota bacterium]
MTLDNRLRLHREELGLSQQALAERVGVSRQAIIAIEGSRQVPSTRLGLQLAQTLGCGVEDLFQLRPLSGLRVRLAPGRDGSNRRATRLALGSVDGRWVGHPLPPDGSIAADGLVTSLGSDGEAVVRPLGGQDALRRNVLVAGCAPLLGGLAQRVATRYNDARLTWLPASSQRALDLLADGLVHVAGLHLAGGETGQDNLSVVRRTFPGRRMLLV